MMKSIYSYTSVSHLYIAEINSSFQYNDCLPFINSYNNLIHYV